MNNWTPKGSDRHDLIKDGKTIAWAYTNGQAIVSAEGGNLHNTLPSLAEAKLWASAQVKRLGY